MTAPQTISDPEILPDPPLLVTTGDGTDGSENTLRAWPVAHRASETFHQFQQLLTDIFPQDTKFAFTLESDPMRRKIRSSASPSSRKGIR